MTIKYINSNMPAGYTLKSNYTGIIVGYSGTIGGYGLVLNNYANVVNKGAIHGQPQATRHQLASPGVELKAGGVRAVQR